MVIFALDPKLDQAIMTLVLASAPKFMWLVEHFDEFWFWNETEIVPENSYSAIWPFLEIHTLKIKILKLFSKKSPYFVLNKANRQFFVSITVFLTWPSLADCGAAF